MARIARSARGEIVDFDILAIKQALASQPINVGVDSRRKFIDARDGVKPAKPVINALKDIQSVPAAMQIAIDSAIVSSSPSEVVSTINLVDTASISITSE